MPVGLFGRGQSPGESASGQSLAYVRVLGDVTVIVVIYEGMPVDRVINCQCQNSQQQAQSRIALLGGREEANVAWGGQYQDLTTWRGAKAVRFAGSIDLVT